MECESGSCVQVDVYTGQHLVEPVVRMRATQTDGVMQMRISEWEKFILQVKAGDWDHISKDFAEKVSE